MWGKKIIYIYTSTSVYASYIINTSFSLKKKFRSRFFSQGKPVTGVGHILAGSFLISDVPFVSQLAFECYGAVPWEHIKSKEGFELQTQPSIKLTLYKTWENPERFPKTNCTNQIPCGWGSFCCTDALWIHKYHSKDGVLTAGNECKHEYKHWEILLVFKNKQKPEWKRKTLPSLRRTCMDKLPNPCLQQVPMGAWFQPRFAIPLQSRSSDTLPVSPHSLCHHLRCKPLPEGRLGILFLSLVSATWVT